MNGDSASASTESPLVTVIVPVYEVEPYLDECITSILDQSHRNLDVILVDDGSPDNAGAMCDDWGALDSRVRVVHKTNGGLSSARNAGLMLARGEYVTFVDSDDVVSPILIERMVTCSQEADSDIVVVEHFPFSTGEPVAFSGTGPVEVVDAGDALRRIVLGGYNWIACARLFRRFIFDSGVKFHEGVLYEDVEFTVAAFSNAQRVAFADWSLYGYRQRVDSIMGKAAKEVSPDLLTVLSAGIDIVRARYPRRPEVFGDVLAGFVIHATTKLERIGIERLSSNEAYTIGYRRFVQANLADILRANRLSRAYRMALMISLLSPRLMLEMFAMARLAKRHLFPRLSRRKKN